MEEKSAAFQGEFLAEPLLSKTAVINGSERSGPLAAGCCAVRST
jgi:hypothetical protein